MQLKDTLCYKLLTVFNHIQEETKPDFQSLGITRENYISMYYIYEHPGVTQAELADLKHKDRNVIGRNIDKLEALGWVQRIRDTQDRRAFTLHLTESGCKVVEHYWPILTRGDQSRLQKLNADEQQTLMALLDKMID